MVNDDFNYPKQSDECQTWTHPSPAAVLGLRNVFGHRMAFVKTNRHRIPDGHVCGEQMWLNIHETSVTSCMCAYGLDISGLYERSKSLNTIISWIRRIQLTFYTRFVFEASKLQHIYNECLRITSEHFTAPTLQWNPPKHTNIRLIVHNNRWKSLQIVYIYKRVYFCDDLRCDVLDINRILMLVILRRFIPAFC